MALVAVTCVFVTGLVAAGRVEAAQTSPEENLFPRVAALDLVRADGSDATRVIPLLAVDTGLRRLVAGGLDHLFLVDLDTLEQRAVEGREAVQPHGAIDLRPFRAATIALDDTDDTRGHRVFLGERAACVSVNVPCQKLEPRSIRVVSLTGEVGDTTYTFEQENTKGARIAALHYHASTDTLFVLTSLKACCDTQGGAVATEVKLHALDAAALGDQSTVADALRWSYPVGPCSEPLEKPNLTPFLGVGGGGEFAYFACKGVSPGGAGIQAVPHGAVRVDFDAPDPASQDPDAFTTEYFPVAADLQHGITSGDASGERLFIFAAGGGNQRLYVFHAGERAWTGSVAFAGGNVKGGTADALTGRVYGLQEGRARVFDAAPVPSTLGQNHSLEVTAINDAQPAFDPFTRRLVVSGPEFSEPGTGVQVEADLGVYEDRSPEFVVPKTPHPDSRTHDIDDADAVDVSFTGGGGAYAARVLAVGGLRSALGPTGTLLDNPNIPAHLRPEAGDRGAFVGRVTDAQYTGNLTEGAATAEAVSLSLDDVTEADLAGKGDLAGVTPRGFPVRHTLEQQCSANPDCSENEEFADARQQLYGQWSTADRCLDEGPHEGASGGSEDSCGEPDDPREDDPDGLADAPTATGVLESHVANFTPSRCSDFGSGPEGSEGGSSRVECDFGGAFVEATARSSDALTASPVRIAGGSSRVTIERDQTRGVVTRVESVVWGVSILDRAFIGEIRAVAETAARGRPGTAGSTYETTVNNVHVVDERGRTVHSCGWDTAGADDPDSRCDPGAVLRAINRTFASKIKVFGPSVADDPLTRGSPGGAQAVVIEDHFAYWSGRNVNFDGLREVPALEIVAYSDTTRASRVVVQLAAVRAESKYFIGQERVEEPLPPAALAITLQDGDGEPLAGGVFTVHRDFDADGRVDAGEPRAGAGTCTTAEDGVGTCRMGGLPPGAHVVHQRDAPAGFIAVGDFGIELSSGVLTEITVVNGRAALPSVSRAPGSVGGEPEFLEFISVADTGTTVHRTELRSESGGVRGALPVLRDGLAVFSRSVGEALLFAAVWSLLGLPLYMRWRRHAWLAATAPGELG